MNELHLALALLIVKNADQQLTKNQLATQMAKYLGGDELSLTNVYRREIDFMITARYLASYDYHHLQLTHTGLALIHAKAPALASMLQMVTRTW